MSANNYDQIFHETVETELTKLAGDDASLAGNPATEEIMDKLGMKMHGMSKEDTVLAQRAPQSRCDLSKLLSSKIGLLAAQVSRRAANFCAQCHLRAGCNPLAPAIKAIR